MSELHPTYIPCASENNAFTDCLLVRAGDLIRILGHPKMDFTAEEAKRLAYHILDLLDNPYRKVPPLMTVSEGAKSSGDAIVDETVSMLVKRSKLGQEKYGTTLMRNDLTLLDWMRHAVEESLDQTLYMLRAIKDLERLYDDGR